MAEKGVLGVQAVTRPSALVVALKVLREEAEVLGEAWRVRVTGMLGAGRPSVVSRTWHVIGGFCGVSLAIAVLVLVDVGDAGVVDKWRVSASTRVVALSGIRWCAWIYVYVYEREREKKEERVRVRKVDLCAVGLHWSFV